MLFFLIEDNKTTYVFHLDPYTETFKVPHIIVCFVKITFTVAVLFEYSQTELTRFGHFVSLTKILLVKCINLHSGTVFADTTSLVNKLFFQDIGSYQQPCNVQSFRNCPSGFFHFSD